MDNVENNFDVYWKSTEVIRQYQQVLYTFGDMKLPYIFVAEHKTVSNRIIVFKGKIYIKKPQIILPGAAGPEFGEGFEELGPIPDQAVLLMRAMNLPYSEISNQVVTEQSLEYGCLSDAIQRYEDQLKGSEDSETGLIKGVADGFGVALMRYSLGLMARSAKSNVKEFFEHMQKQQGSPIGPDEHVTDDDLRRLFS